MDLKNKKVPTGFPATLLISTTDGKNYLNSHYRLYTDNQWEEEFQYFMARIMPALAPSRNKYKKNKGTKKLSEIYTVSDEAFGLLVLHNELHCWDEASKKGTDEETPSTLKSKKRFCDSGSGRKQGWSADGRMLYEHLCWGVHNRRKDPTSKTMEEDFMAKYSMQSPSNQNRPTIIPQVAVRWNANMADD